MHPKTEGWMVNKNISRMRNEVLMLTCFPLALRMPPVTADVPSNTWKSESKGMIEAVRATTSGSSLKRYAHE